MNEGKELLDNVEKMLQDFLKEKKLDKLFSIEKKSTDICNDSIQYSLTLSMSYIYHNEDKSYNFSEPYYNEKTVYDF